VTALANGKPPRRVEVDATVESSTGFEKLNTLPSEFECAVSLESKGLAPCVCCDRDSQSKSYEGFHIRERPDQKS
jgi:hypothetical protein